MSRSRRRKQRGDALGLLVIASVALGLMGVGVAAMALRPPPLDPQTNCAIGRAPATHAIILVDATDTLSPRHRRRLQAALEELRATLDVGDRLDIFALTPKDGSEPRLVFSACDPGGAQEANPWLADPVAAQARERQTFVEPSDAALRRASAAVSGPEETPLLDALVTVAQTPGFSTAGRRVLVLGSDLLEHRAGGLSLYDRGARFEAWVDSPDAAGRMARLEGATVRLVVFDRTDHAATQDVALNAFWASYFDTVGARLEDY